MKLAKLGDISEADLNSPILYFLTAFWFLLFDTSTSGVAFTNFQFITSVEWSLIFILIGAVRAAGILIGSKLATILSLIAAILIWIVVAALFGTVNYRGLGIPVFSYLAYINALRLREALKRRGK